MTRICLYIRIPAAAAVLLVTAFPCRAALDSRNIRNGREIPTRTYADQPYVVATDGGAWLCLVTTGSGREGSRGQHVVSLRSLDQGRTWSEPVALEPPEGPEASYAVPLKVPYGRVYAFYNHNTDNLRRVRAENPPYKDGFCYRVDSLGYYVFKYSDDDGRHWSSQRHVVPVREMAIDRENPYGGEIRFFWNVGKPFIYGGAAFVPLTKVGGFGRGFFTRNEGILLKSNNLLTERDPEKIRWETLPDGEHGLRTPPGGGPIAAEQSYAVLGDGSFFCVYRTMDGHPVCTYSRDGGHTWEEPRYMRFANGNLIKHPRAANFVWRTAPGKYLYWFHNHGGQWYEDRNPAWLCGGVEREGPRGRELAWSQPEILLYDPDPFIRISYPDMVRTEGGFYFTETQKNVARVHAVDPELVEGLWSQFALPVLTTNGMVLEGTVPGEHGAADFALPPLPSFVVADRSRPDHGLRNLNHGFTVELAVRFASLKSGQVLLDNRDGVGRGFALLTTGRGQVEILMNDGREECRWAGDPGRLEPETLHHLGIVVDGGPRIIEILVDGRLCDGGEYRQFGWGRFSPHLRDVHGAPQLRVAPTGEIDIPWFRVFQRPLRISELVGNYRTFLESEDPPAP